MLFVSARDGGHFVMIPAHICPLQSMEKFLQAFGKIAPYLKHPLVLVGFLLLLFFGIHSRLIESGIIPPLTPEAGSGVVYVFLKYGFIIALAVIVLGFALAFFQTHHHKS
jgi:hypothetical protein